MRPECSAAVELALKPPSSPDVMLARVHLETCRDCKRRTARILRDVRSAGKQDSPGILIRIIDQAKRVVDSALASPVPHLALRGSAAPDVRAELPEVGMTVSASWQSREDGLQDLVVNVVRSGGNPSIGKRVKLRLGDESIEVVTNDGGVATFAAITRSLIEDETLELEFLDDAP